VKAMTTSWSLPTLRSFVVRWIGEKAELLQDDIGLMATSGWILAASDWAHPHPEILPRVFIVVRMTRGRKKRNKVGD